MPSRASNTVRVYYRNRKYNIPEDFATRLHPGGKDILMRYKDCDITKVFEMTQHTVDAVAMLNSWAADNVEYTVPVKESPLFEVDCECNEVEVKEREKTKRWNRLAIAFGIASIVAAVQMRKQ